MFEHAQVAPPSEMVGTWSVDLGIDPGWYELKGTLADQPCPHPSAGQDELVPLTEHTTLIGRHAESGVQPGVEIAGDRGVSRRHAQFVYDGDQLTIVDLSSTNGTYVIDASSRPSASTQPLVPGVPVVLRQGDQVFLGAWSRLTVRATR